MIQILLLILKIIGITLLAVLGFLLLVLALVLFVPVFYRVRIVHNPEKTIVKARVSFLFPLLLVTVEYLKKVSYKVRIFGIALMDSDKPKKEKTSKKQKIKKKKKHKEKNREEKKQNPAPEVVPEQDTGQTIKPELPREESRAEKEKTDKTDKTDGQVKLPDSEESEEKQSFFEKIRSKIKKTRETISNVVRKIKRFWHIKEEVQRIFAKPETKEALRFAWDKLKRLLKHILPRKIKGYLAFGADNPATTGQVLGILGVVYAKTGQLLEIRPNFMEKQLECDVLLKGRIQVFTLLVIAVKVFLNQELRQLISECKGLKEIE